MMHDSRENYLTRKLKTMRAWLGKGRSRNYAQMPDVVFLQNYSQKAEVVFFLFFGAAESGPDIPRTIES